MNKKPEKKRKYRIRVVPSFSVKIVTSERAARKELDRIAERLYRDRISGMNAMLLKDIVIEVSKDDEWVSFITMNNQELFTYYKDEVLAK